MFYPVFYRLEVLRRFSERMEIVVDIYEGVDAVRGHDPNPECSDTKRGLDTDPHTGKVFFFFFKFARPKVHLLAEM